MTRTPLTVPTWLSSASHARFCVFCSQHNNDFLPSRRISGLDELPRDYRTLAIVNSLVTIALINLISFWNRRDKPLCLAGHGYRLPSNVTMPKMLPVQQLLPTFSFG